MIRIPSIDFTAPGGILLDRDVYLDAAGTRIQGAATGADPIISVANNAVVTIEGIRLVEWSTGLDVGERARVTLFDSTLDTTSAEVHDPDGELRVIDSRMQAAQVDCSMNAKLEVQRCDFLESGISSDFCNLTVARSHFFRTNGPEILIDQYPPALIENNVFEAQTTTQSFFFLLTTSYGVPTGPTTIRFNTMINRTPQTTSPQQIVCGGQATPLFTGNIILAGTPGLLTGTPCTVDHSLFDDATGAPAGTGNITAPAASIFVDLAGGDYRPAGNSGAPGAADPTQTIDEDYYGGARPQPAGSVSDAGAIEVP